MIEADRKAIVQFKRECRNYYYYLADIKQTMYDIKRLNHKMSGVHSLDFERVRSDTPIGSRKSKIVTYIEANEALERELQRREGKVQYILDTINRIEVRYLRAVVWMLYVQRKRVQDVADEYAMSRDYLTQQISEELALLFPLKKKAGETQAKTEGDVIPEAVEEEDSGVEVIGAVEEEVPEEM